MTQQTSNPSQSMPLNPVLMGYPTNGSSQYQANYNYNSAAAYYHAQQQQQQVAQSPSQHHQAAVMSAAAAAMFNDNDQYPTYEDFQCIVQEYLDNLSPKKRDKALVDQHRYTLILQVLKDPRNTAISTAQFRFWVKKMFQLAPTDTLDIVCHDNKPVAMREQIYEILVRAHREAHHGGRDKTSALVRRRYSWIPKELIARFVRNCPFCISRRNSSQSPSIGAPKTPSPTSSYPENNGVPSYVYDGSQTSHFLRTPFEDDDLSYKTLTPEMDFDYVPTGPQSNTSSVVVAAAAAAAAAAANCHGPASPSQHYIPDPFGNTNYYYASQQPPSHQAFAAQRHAQASSQQQDHNDQQRNNLAYAMVEMGMHPFASSENYGYQQPYGNPYTDILGMTRVPPQDECFQDLSSVGRPASATAVAGVDLLSHHRLFQ
ncbi:hypothetical protein K450DRAFT_274397 [Umbelopsis ramanniana AG]|uniref:Integrase zinc-binding domain-containing protein n=1 Tax=Umbelopsis ramanniana AG TaxID=1314678 RepID=A0AAD5E449_UMBRA|nr:uncharacterized protein K450DRAFT_274397 [Umbelopsis ramanniana AG]KAI8576818.1 hypothetical protein K450DRAFT_274397 [Umbelopsis ramanniana AG]